jgi:hypothetical protein
LGFLLAVVVTCEAEIFLFVVVGAENWSLDDHRGADTPSGDCSVTRRGCGLEMGGCNSEALDPLDEWRLNMSLIFRLLSNSGISLAEKKGRSFALWSRIRLPSTNILSGFMMS